MKLGIQSYSLRRFTLEESVKITNQLGLEYIEAFPGHLPPTPEGVNIVKELGRKYDVKIIAHGVNHMSPERDKLEALFKFAKEAGIKVLTADPDPDAIPILDELVRKYKVRVAIHNHGPGHRYARCEDVIKIVGEYSELIGMCLDTGHLARAGGNIVEAVKNLGPRLHGVHLKDINEEGKDVIIGRGVLDFKEFFKTMKDIGVLESAIIVIEYELEPENPIPGIKESLRSLREILREV